MKDILRSLDILSDNTDGIMQGYPILRCPRNNTQNIMQDHTRSLQVFY